VTDDEGTQSPLSPPSQSLLCELCGLCVPGPQNIIRKPNRIDRSLTFIVCVICPNVEDRNVPFGFMKCGVLVTLKMSARNSPFTLPNENSFASVASRFTYFGPSSTPFLAAFPNVLAAGDENTDVSNQRLPDPMPPSTAGVPV